MLDKIILQSISNVITSGSLVKNTFRTGKSGLDPAGHNWPCGLYIPNRVLTTGTYVYTKCWLSVLLKQFYPIIYKIIVCDNPTNYLVSN